MSILLFSNPFWLLLQQVYLFYNNFSYFKAILDSFDIVWLLSKLFGLLGSPFGYFHISFG